MLNRRLLLAGAGSALTVAPAAALCALPALALLTPEQRIDAAVADIKAALGEMYPGFEIFDQLGFRQQGAGVVVVAHAPVRTRL